MPRTVQDILDHAEELAKRFEDDESKPATSETRKRSPRYEQPCWIDPTPNEP